MSLAHYILIGLTMGVVFGFALEKSRVFEPGIIVGQMQLRTFIMLKVFLTAVATGAVALAVMHGVGLVTLAPKPTLYGADIIGGLVLGAGIALAGACPGTVMAQVGVGYCDALVTRGLGARLIQDLNSAGVRVYVTGLGTVAQAMEAYARGDLPLADAQAACGHAASHDH